MTGSEGLVMLSESVADMRVAVVGSMNADCVIRVPDLPQAGETVFGTGAMLRPGGKGLNQAVAAARLGAQVEMVGAVGRDGAGDWLLRVLEDAGVGTYAIARVDEHTGCAFVAVDATGENQIVILQGANQRACLPEAGLPNCDVVLAQLEIPLDTVRAAAMYGGFVCLNASPSRHLPPSLLSSCNVIVVNEREYEACPEISESPLLAVTLGGEGSRLVASGEEIARVPAPRVPAVDSVGAGDAFAAALALALAANWPAEEALSVATWVGAMVVMRNETYCFRPVDGLRGEASSPWLNVFPW
jgi:ribokinase